MYPYLLVKKDMISSFKTTPCKYICKAMTLPVVSLVFCAFTASAHPYPPVAVLPPAAHDTIPSEVPKTRPADADSIDTKKTVLNLNAGDSLLITFGDDQASVTNHPQNQSANDDKVFSKVEIESSYPGGGNAWMEYMIRTFRYPMEAQRKGIQGTVVLQFIVDKEGNVSNVEAVSGPTEGGLRKEAIRVIKQSGKWMPALQDGRPVKSYKKQPIIFMLSQ